MNKIFRIVWSQATQSWVVVSELTKAHKKQSASNAQKSAVKFSGNFIKSSAIALALLSGHSAYAAVAGSEGHANAVAFGPDSNASTDGSVALGKQAKATGGEAAALGKGAKAEGNLSVAVAPMSQATADSAMAFGVESKASGAKAVALGRMAVATQESAVALGFKSKATSFNTVALGTNTEAAGQRSMAFGNEAKATANDTIAFGSSSEAKKNNDIIIGKEAKSRDEGGGHSVAIGLGATSGSNKVNYDRNGGDAGSVAIGTGAYTGVNRNNVALNSSVAIGAGAGAGFRSLDANNNNMPAGNATDVESNDEVLKKAFGVKDVKDYAAIAGGANGYTNVDINEATALGRNARAIGDQAVAIGAQTIAGMGAIALGGNDITQFAHKKYYKSTKDNFKVTETIDHNQDAVVSNRTISQTYKDLVGTELDTAYKATYAQDGSVVLGAQAHSGTPLGTAIGTNALVRKGAFGATAIGAGSQIQANAEAAVAIGMVCC
ncbi:ESPR-type extended signal peptide-containing protein [Haemophilus haemolyticus]|uniref:ESPR-type extended signal peptide-containing protein n=1 Tax=Haemophilus haemolyticus TaxID=726 RepID=UPI000E5857E2|nr:ESPR-type extended signal peptide-containing protein [Haemophilus haemolyticus]